MRLKAQSRRAVAPIIATVVLVSATIVTSVVMGSFVYGTEGSSANTALVQAQATQIPYTIATGFTFLLCAPNQGNFVGVSGYIQLYNYGTKAVKISSLHFTYAGQTVVQAPTGPCVAPPDQSVYLLIVALPLTTPPTTGVPYTGYVSVSNGAEVLFTGDFM